MSVVPRPAQTSRVVSFRGIILGLCGVVLVSALTPYNDVALNNTMLVGNNLPLAVVVLSFLFVLLVNAPLWRWAPRYAFSAGEITIAFIMILVSCALPGSGLMRHLPVSLVIPFWHAQANPQFMEILERINPPRWLFPEFEGASPEEWARDPIVTDFHGRWLQSGPYPYAAWVRPALTWGIFIFALYGAMICMVCLVRRQWHDNERLPFPLAQIHLSLLEQPAPGKALNPTLRQRAFWIAFVAVFVLHGWNGLHLYYPRYVEQIPLGYDLSGLLSEDPWVYTHWFFKVGTLYLTVVGVTYFLSSSVAFSLWIFFIIAQVLRMYRGMMGEPTLDNFVEQRFGAATVFALIVLWLGRKQWQIVLAQAFRGWREGEPGGRYISNAAAFWIMLACTGVMIGWLVAAGATGLGAVVTVLFLLMIFLVLARVVAETGLVQGQIAIGLTRPWELAIAEGLAPPVPVKTFYLGAIIQSHHADFREPLPVYASHSLKVADQTVFGNRQTEPRGDRSLGRKLVFVIILALVVGYVVSFTSTLWTHYTYASTRDITEQMPVDSYAANRSSGRIVMPTVRYEQENIPLAHSPWRSISFGAVMTGILAYLRFSFTWWPVHPVGYVMMETFAGTVLWFSLFVGWLIKVVIVRFGGAGLYTAAKPFFIGMIVGEAVAAGSWLVISVILSSMGVQYIPVHILPQW